MTCRRKPSLTASSPLSKCEPLGQAHSASRTRSRSAARASVAYSHREREREESHRCMPAGPTARNNGMNRGTMGTSTNSWQRHRKDVRHRRCWPPRKSASIPPSVGSISGLSEACGFPVIFSANGRFRVTVYFNADGSLRRFLEHPSFRQTLSSQWSSITTDDRGVDKVTLNEGRDAVGLRQRHPSARQGRGTRHRPVAAGDRPGHRRAAGRVLPRHV
jgi:hypothetical protein